jgi:hypothetical protein
MLKLPQVRIVPAYTPFSGGLDLVTPTIESKPGRCRLAQNCYQDQRGGYKTLEGYERYSGQTAPSGATYSILQFSVVEQIMDGDQYVMDGDELVVDGSQDGFAGAVSVGDTISNAAGTVTALVLHLLSGGLVITKATGTFTAGIILVGGVAVGNTTGAYLMTTVERDAYYKSLAANAYRADIAAVTGAGAVRGIWYYGGKWYAYRDNAGGTAGGMFVASTSGWTSVALGWELPFTSGGATEIVATNTVVGETSAASAVVTRVVLESGSWAGGDAAGRLIFATKTGNFAAETLKIGATLDVASIAGNATAITLTPGGTYEFVNDGFTGSAASVKMYGVNGVNRGWEYDGAVFVPISTGMTTDTPAHVYGHKNHLFYSFLWSVQHSSLGFPYQWTPVTGADEFGMGDNVTAFVSLPGSEDSATLAIFSRNSIGMLYGSGADNWQLLPYKREAGAIARTVQLIGNVFAMDDRGITKLAQSQAYGNFEDATVSKLVQPWLAGKKALVAASCVVREKNQYWLFFTDKTAMCFTIQDGEITASMPMLFAHQVTCACSAETTSGEEVVMLGFSDGYVRQLFKGTSFDGEPLEWFFELSYDHSKSPTTRKRYRKGTFEVEGDGYAAFGFSFALEFGNPDVQQPATQLSSTDFKPEYWDSFLWDSFFWDGHSLSPSYFRMFGTGTNMSIILQGKGTYNSSVRFSGSVVQYTPTREIV